MRPHFSMRRVSALMLKYWYITFRRLDRVFDLFYWPVVGLLLWGFTSAYFGEQTSPAMVQFLLGGTILWTFFIRGQQDIAVYILEDFWNNSLYNLFASPITSTELALSTVLFGFLRSAVAFVYLLILAWLTYSYNLLGIGVLNVVLMSLGLMVFGSVIGLIVAGIIFRYGQSVQVFAWSVGWLIQPFSAVFYPLSVLPPWAIAIAKVMPTTYVFEGMRAALAGRPVWGYLGTSFALNFVFLILGSWFFIASVEKARKKGILTKSE